MQMATSHLFRFIGGSLQTISVLTRASQVLRGQNVLGIAEEARFAIVEPSR